VRCFLGRASEALAYFERVIMLSPRETTLFRVYAGLALAHLLLERFEESVKWARRALESNPNFTPSYRVLAAALAHLGRTDEARKIGQRLLTLMPHFSTETEKLVFRQSGRLSLFLDGLRMAGLPS
jgi:adenylate cyclase